MSPHVDLAGVGWIFSKARRLPLPVSGAVLLFCLGVAVLWRDKSWWPLPWAAVGLLMTCFVCGIADQLRQWRWPDAVLASAAGIGPPAAAVLGEHLGSASLLRIGRRRGRIGATGSLVVRGGQVRYVPGLFSRLDGVKPFTIATTRLREVRPAEHDGLPGLLLVFPDGASACIGLRTDDDLARVCSQIGV